MAPSAADPASLARLRAATDAMPAGPTRERFLELLRSLESGPSGPTSSVAETGLAAYGLHADGDAVDEAEDDGGPPSSFGYDDGPAADDTDDTDAATAEDAWGSSEPDALVPLADAPGSPAAEPAKRRRFGRRRA